MKQRAKTFYGILGILAFSLVLGACANDEPVKPVDNSKLKLSGQVYTQNTDPSALLSNTPNKFNGNLIISDGGQGGTGQIENGQLSYFIGIPQNLSPIGEGEGLDFLKGNYPSLQFSSEDVNVAVVALEITGSDGYSGLLKGSLKIEPNFIPPPTIKITIKTVNYVYVDKDLTITANADTFVYDYFDIPISLTTDIINLNLKTGWNSLYSEITAQSNIPPELITSLYSPNSDLSNLDLSNLDLTALEPKGNLKMSVLDPATGDPDTLKWTLVPSQTLDDL